MYFYFWILYFFIGNPVSQSGFIPSVYYSGPQTFRAEDRM